MDLILTVERNDLANVERLFDKGANINRQGSFYGNALQAAVAEQHLEIVEFLVDKGADVCFQDTFQMTALHYAAQGSAAEIVEFLLGRNARPDAKNDTGATPFDFAIKAKDEKTIRLLLSKMEPPPLISTKSWRYLSIESIKGVGLRPWTYDEEKNVQYIRFFYHQFRHNEILTDARMSHDFMDPVPKDPVHIVLDKGMWEKISPSSTFGCRWWRRTSSSWAEWPSQASPLPSPDLCRQLDPRDFFIESWFTISCLTITDSNWPSQQMLIPEAYDYLEQVEGFFWVTAKRPKSDFAVDRSIGELLRPVFPVTTCGDTPIKLIESIEDLITPLIEKFGQTFEENCLQASRQLLNSRLEVLRNGGCNEVLLHRLLSDATVIEHMTENHAHIVRSLIRLIDCVAGLQNGPWKLSEQAQRDSRQGIERLQTHRGTLRELLERSQNTIQLEFNLASILEARKTTSTNRSLKRLTWVTFVFLPLLFVASLFGMNVDILSDNPSWWWYFPVAGGFILFTFGVWIFFKRFNTLEGSLERYFAWLIGDGTQPDAKQPVGRKEERRSSE
ncbi:hypothetical protein F4782DRAFT_532944 [Xylaria castorea]|nr:hypothetical protein F4782DRAFT_532944 [Xylaria castorea]